MKWASRLPPPLDMLLSSYIPPLVIALINAVLLLLVMYQSEMNRHDTYSAYQKQVFKNCTLYLVANIILIPIVSLKGPVWLLKDSSVLAEVYHLIYEPRTVIFYCIMVT